MNLKRKIEIAVAAVASIETHTDEDSTLRKAALDKVGAAITAAKSRIDTEANNDVAALAE